MVILKKRRHFLHSLLYIWKYAQFPPPYWDIATAALCASTIIFRNFWDNFYIQSPNKKSKLLVYNFHVIQSRYVHFEKFKQLFLICIVITQHRCRNQHLTTLYYIQNINRLIDLHNLFIIFICKHIPFVQINSVWL